MNTPYKARKIKKLSLAEEAYNYLKEQIISGKIHQGDVITEQSIANELRISRTPLKNAISKLESENFVTTLNGRGTLVNVLSIADMRDIYNVRTVLEVLALETTIHNLSEKMVQQACESFQNALALYKKDKSLVSPEMMYELDNQFHNMIVDYTSNHYIRRLMPSLSERINVRQLQAYQITDTFETSTKQHLEILEAIAMKNLARAKLLLEEHLKWSFAVMFDALLQRYQKNNM